MKTKNLKTYFELPSTASRGAKFVESCFGVGVKALRGRKISLLNENGAENNRITHTPGGKKRAGAIALLIVSTVCTLGILPTVITILHYRAAKNYFAVHDRQLAGDEKILQIPTVEEIKKNNQKVFSDIEHIGSLRAANNEKPLSPYEAAQEIERMAEDRLKPEQIAAVVERPEYASLRRSLALQTNDVESVDRIIYYYATILRDKIPAAHRAAFEGWMHENAIFLGSSCFNHNLFYTRQKDLGNKFFSGSFAFRVAFRSFVKKAQNYTGSVNDVSETAEKVRNIAILYPGLGGGGHKAPAQAMAKHLTSQGYNVKMIDVSEIRKRNEPLIEGMCHDEIYTRVYQQEGNKDRALQMWQTAVDTHPIATRRFIREITDDLREFKPEHIFYVAHYLPELASISYKTGVEGTFIHTDHEFCPALIGLAKKQMPLEDPLVRFTSLAANSAIFKPLYEGVQNHYSYLPEKLRRQMIRMNFPVRAAFQPVSIAEKGQIRDELNIARNAIVVKVAMGSNGIPKEIKEMISKIKRDASSSSKPIEVLVICGTNTALKDELEQMAELQTTPGVHFRVLGFLNEQQMSDYDKASDVWVTKPGGSTTAEAAKMRKQVIYIPTDHHDWELANAKDLEGKSLAEQIVSGNENLVAQIVRRARLGETIEYRDTNEESWTDQLESIIDGSAEPLLATA